MTRKEEIEEQANGMQIMSWPLHTSYIKMAEWADITVIEKACRWLKDNIDHYAYNKDFVTIEDFIKSFRKAMEE